MVHFEKGILLGASEARELLAKSLRLTSEFACARIAGANLAQMIKTIDARGVSVGELDLNSIGSNGRGCSSSHLRLVHRKSRRWAGATMIGAALFMAFSARCARTVFAQIRKFVMAGMSVGPGNVDARSRRNVNLHINWLFPNVQWQRHKLH